MKKKPGGTPAIIALSAAGVAFDVYEFDAGSDHFGQHAAAAMAEVGLSEEQVFKTLILALEGAPRPGLGLVCVPVDAKVSMKKAAAAFGVRKAQMADEKSAHRATGYVFGGTSPVGQKTQLPTVIDETASLWDVVCVSAGKRGMDVALAPDDLVAVTGGSYADVSA
ncbi:Cys-tRNA(Pro) deacylase [Corynebacterium sp. 13CS0277]|nr:Cys-tRNA(Pro) deacylase [Corynebacterium sp. 13CS0277]